MGKRLSRENQKSKFIAIDKTKKIIEKGWLQRGNKIIVTGIKKDDIFIAKKYSRTPYHLVELIEQIDGHEIITRGERLEEIIND